MNKKVLGSIIALVIIIGGSATYALVRPGSTDESVENNEVTTSTNTDQIATTNPAQQSEPGLYTDYSENVVASTKGTKLLFFHAPWCTQCRKVEASIKQDGLPNNVTVFKVDYDSNQDLRKKYGVTLQTTFVKIDDNGNKISSYVAYDDPTFSAVQKALL